MKHLFIAVFMLVSLALQAQYIPRFDLQGHRGARGLRPENTIPGFLLALDSGVTTLEMDVVITKDNQVILSHDPYLLPRLCLQPDGTAIPANDKKFRIYELTAAEVQQFDCGSLPNSGFPEQLAMKVSKPLLREVIAAVEAHIKSKTSYEVDYNIEIKATPDGDKVLHPAIPEFCDLVIAEVGLYLPLERVVIQSFDFRVLQYIHKTYPKVRLSALVENRLGIEKNLANLGFHPEIYSPYFKAITASDVKALHAKRIRVIPWTVNDPKDLLAVKAMGVDGLITDYPDRARRYKMTLNLPLPSGN